MNRWYGATSAIVLAFGLGVSPMADAQVAEEASQQPVEGDIVVTATRRQSALSDVPISLVAETQEALDQKGVKDISAIARTTPGLNFAPGANGGNSISIRGIASNIGASTTGVYIDNTPIQARQVGAGQSGGTVFPTVFDLERVEILRGPQGTLFGAGSQGGTVRFITPAPGLSEYSAYGRAELAFTDGGDPTYEAGAAVGGPIIEDKLGFRVSAFYRNQGGWVDRASFKEGYQDLRKNENDRTSLVLRGALAWKPAENIKITPSLFYERSKLKGTESLWLTLIPAASKPINGNPYRESSDDEFILPALDVEFDAGPFDIVSNTSYFDRKRLTISDYTTFFTQILTGQTQNIPPVPSFYATSEFPIRQKIFTQELRFQSNGSGPLSWVVGGFYQRARQSARQLTPTLGMDDFIGFLTGGLTAEQLFGYPLLPANPSTTLQAPLTADLLDRTTDEQVAVFGQFDYELTDWLTLTAGARYAETKFNFTNRQEGQLAGGLTSGAGQQKENPFTPKFGVSIRPAEGQLLYATAAKGFRTGGANTPIASSVCGDELQEIGLGASPDTYDADTVWSYEVGTKNQLFDRRVSLAASAFYIEWSGIQRSVYLQCGYTFITNAGGGRSKGFDAQIDVRPVDGLTLSASVAYNKAYLTDDVLGGIVNAATGERSILLAKGSRIGASPWTLHLSGEYQVPVGSFEGFVRADWDYRSSYEGTPRPPSASYDPILASQDAQHFLALRAGLQRDRWTISAFVDNVTNSKDRVPLAHGARTLPLITYSLQRPRTVGLTASYRY